MNTVTLTEESAIIPLKRLNEYKDLEIQIGRILRDETKFFSIITEYRPGAGGHGTVMFAVPTDWEVKQAFQDEIKKMGNRHREELERIKRDSHRGMGFDEAEIVVRRESKKKYWSGWWTGVTIGMILGLALLKLGMSV